MNNNRLKYKKVMIDHHLEIVKRRFKNVRSGKPIPKKIVREHCINPKKLFPGHLKTPRFRYRRPK